MGTWHYGRANVCERYGPCPVCHSAGVLASYDTGRYAVLFYIPVLPLGRLRITDHCAACGHSQAQSLRFWRAERQALFADLRARYRRDRHNVGLVRQIQQACVIYRQHDVFANIAPETLRRFAGNAEIAATIGDGYGALGMLEQAEDAYDQALALAVSTAVLERLAIVQIRLLKPQEAAASLAHLLEKPTPEALPLLAMLARGYQAVGDHSAALEIFDLCLVAQPSLDQDADFAYFQSVSRQLLETKRPLSDPAVTTTGARGAPDPASRIAPLVPLLILTVLLGLYAAVSVNMAKRHTIWLVNGLAKPYTVTIAGKNQRLPPFQAVALTVPEDVYQVTAEVPSIQELTVDCRRSFWQRPISSSRLVINPDQAAVLTRQVAQYSESGVRFAEPTFSVGRSTYTFTGVHRMFEPFPETLRLSESGTAKVVALRLEPDLFGLPEGEWRAVAAVAANRRLAHDLRDEEAAVLLSQRLRGEPGPALEAALLAEPPSLTLHQAFHQIALERPDVMAWYQQATAELADGPQAALIQARLLPPDAAAELLAEHADASVQARLQLANYHNACSYFQTVIASLPAAPADEATAISLLTAHMSEARGPAPEEIARSLRERFPDSLQLRLMGMQLAPRKLDQVASEKNALVAAHQAYFQGDRIAFMKLVFALPEPDPDLMFAAALSAGALQRARDVLGKNPLPEQLLLLYLLHQDERGRAVALDQLKDCYQQDPSRSHLLPILDGTGLAPHLDTLAYGLAESAALCLLVAEKYPELAIDARARAERLSWLKNYPHLTIRALLEKAR